MRALLAANSWTLRALQLDSDASGTIKGEWFPALSGQSFPASLLVEAKRFIVLGDDETELASGALGEIKISPRIGSISRALSLPDASQFVTADNAAIDAIASGRTNRWNGFVHSLERFHPRLLGLVIAVFVLGIAIYRFALPVLIEVAVRVTPPVATDMMAKGAMQTLDRVAFSASTLAEERKTALAGQFVQLAAFSPSGAAKFNLNFREGGIIGPNAFALPDGTIVITDELIAMADGDDELILGVLAHEMGHVEHEHSLRQLYRAAGVAGLVMMIGGDIGEGAQDLLVQGAGLLTLSFSREAESQADRHSVEIMLKAGRDPLAIARFFEVLGKKLGDTGGTSMLSTHPGTPERRAAASAYAKELGAMPAQ
jgi:Zn-dependent protease with chaperone function